jgi:hypothetical protein
MKKLLLLSVIVCGVAIFFSSCEKATIDSGSFSKIYDPSAPIDSVHFSADIMPILTGNCVTCHSGSQVPVMDASIYTNLMNGYIVAGSPSTSPLYIKLTDLNSSHVNRATSPQKDLIFTWISQGALNN